MERRRVETRREEMGSDEDGQLQRQRRSELRGAHGVPRGICNDGFIENQGKGEMDKDKDKDQDGDGERKERIHEIPPFSLFGGSAIWKNVIISTLLWTSSRELCSSVGLSNLDSAYSQT